MNELDIRSCCRKIDSLVIGAGSLQELYRKLNTLRNNASKDWQLLRNPVWMEDRLIAVVVKADPAAMADGAWHPGPPPRRDDGHVVLVRFKRLFSGACAIRGTDAEYYGGPVAVTCWGEKLKTTVNPERFSYDQVESWCEVPE